MSNIRICILYVKEISCERWFEQFIKKKKKKHNVFYNYIIIEMSKTLNNYYTYVLRTQRFEMFN